MIIISFISDVDSEESPKKDGICRKALQDCSNMHPRHRSFIAKEDVSNFSSNRLPVYMQKELQLNKASSVNNYKPNKKGITKCKKKLNTKSHISRPEKTKSNFKKEEQKKEQVCAVICV